MENNELKNAVEALLFASERPLSAEEIRGAFEEKLDLNDLKACLENLKNEYEAQDRGFRLYELAGGYQLVTDSKYASYLKRFYQAREKKRLSQASLETLSVIAYRQPVTKAEIEFIRGVNVDGALRTLIEKGIVRMTGRKDLPGRPILYGTTDEFLQHFGLNSLKDLPPLKEYSERDLEEHLVPPEMRQAAGVQENASDAERNGAGHLEENEGSGHER